MANDPCRPAAVVPRARHRRLGRRMHGGVGARTRRPVRPRLWRRHVQHRRLHGPRRARGCIRDCDRRRPLQRRHRRCRAQRGGIDRSRGDARRADARPLPDRNHGSRRTLVLVLARPRRRPRPVRFRRTPTGSPKRSPRHDWSISPASRCRFTARVASTGSRPHWRQPARAVR